MTAVLDGLASSTDADDRRDCPECRARFAPRDSKQLFCSIEHRRAWNNRWTVRGAVLAPLATVARLTRNGTRGAGTAVRVYGSKAGRDQDVLLRRWQAEDRAAGRMELPEYLALRYACGFDPV